MNLCRVTMKHGCLVVFICHDFAEIRGFRYGLTLGIGNLKIMASASVFVRVVCTLKSGLVYTPHKQRGITRIDFGSGLV